MQDGANSAPKQLVVLAASVPFVGGATAVVGQIVCMREVMAAFNGNELSLGIVLAIWLIWTAVGSGWFAKLFRSVKDIRRAAGIVGSLSGVSLLITVAAIRAARAMLQSVPGEVLGPVATTVTSFLCLSLFCLFSGCLFTLAAHFYRDVTGTAQPLAVSTAYLFETLGAAAGGVLTSLVLLRVFSSFQIACVITILNLCMASLLIVQRRWRAPLITGWIATGAVLIMYAAPHMERITEERLWPGFQLVDLHDSVYGRLNMLRTGENFSIYENGGIVANLPDPAAAEEAVHYALLEHPAPQRILVIGGGLNGSIAEALKHPTVRRVDYVELDPALIAMGATAGVALSDPRIQIHLADGRLYLNSTTELFDVIIVSTPDPDNAQLNRFYTAEFFGLVRNHLSSGGFAAIQLRSSEEVVSPEMAEFQRCIYATLREQLPYTAMIPGDTLHLFGARNAGVLTEEPRVLMSRLRSRPLQNVYVREYLLPYRMAPDRMAQIHEVLQPRPDTTRNHDTHPVAYYFATILWTAQANATYAHLLRLGSQLHFTWLISGVVVLSFVFAIIWAAGMHKSRRVTAGWSVISTGYTSMALEILLLLSFQSVYGYVYQELAMLISAMMAGIAVGSWWGMKAVRRGSCSVWTDRAAANQLMLAIAAPLLLAIIGLLSQSAHASSGSMIAAIAFPMFAFLAGVPGGFQFPVASAIFQNDSAQQSGSGTLYALDLIGGGAGAAALTGFLIPLFGFWNTAWLTAAVAAGPAFAGVLSKASASSTRAR